MADKNLQDRIIRLLNGKAKKTEALAKIVQTLRVPKKSVNNQLYRLQREGRVIKVEDSPPVWSISDGSVVAVHGNPAGAARGTRRRQKSGNSEKEEETDEDLERKILEYLQRRQKPTKTLVIAKGTGHSRSAEINTTLYGLLSKGLIEQNTKQPPTWSIAPEASGSAIDNSRNNALPSSTMSVEQNQHQAFARDGVPVFQETELFKTDLSFESDTNDLFGNGSGNTEDNIGEDGDAEMRSQDSYGQADEILDSDGGFKPDPVFGVSVESDSRSDFEKTEETGDVTKESVKDNDNSFSTEDIGSKEAMFEEIDESTNVQERSEDDYEVEKYQRVSEDSEKDNRVSDDNSRRDLLQKPRTFRTFFNLDDTMSDDSNSQHSSSGNLDNGDLETDGPDLPSCSDYSNRTKWDWTNSPEQEQLCSTSTYKGQDSPPVLTAENVKKSAQNSRATATLKSTPQILEDVLDLEDTCNLTDESENPLDQKDQEFTEGYSKADETDEAYSISMEEGTNDMPVDEDNFEGICMDKESPETRETHEDDEDMIDCDKVLKVLSELKAMAQFVLKKKIDIPPENLDSALEKCQKLNYVSGSSKLWKVTDEGLDYIAKKMGENFDNSVELKEPVRKVKPKFKGPPPPPMALLNKQNVNHEIEGNKQDFQDKHVPKRKRETVVSRISDSLFKVPEAAVGNNSGNEPVHSFPNQTSKPVPLMSIQFDHPPQLQVEREQMDIQSTGQFTREQPAQSNGQFGMGSNLGVFESSTLFQQTPKSILKKPSQTFASDTNSRNTNKNNPSQFMLVGRTSKQTVNESQSIGDLEKYADYPNKSTTQELLNKKPKSKRTSSILPGNSAQVLRTPMDSGATNRLGSSGQSSSAFKKGPPPSPMDILAKNMKKTEISPPSSYQTEAAISQSNGAITTTTVSRRSSGPFGGPVSSEVNFSSGQFAQTGYQNFSGKQPEKQTVVINQYTLSQSHPLGGNQMHKGYHSLPSENIGQFAKQQSGFQSLPSSFSAGCTGQNANQNFGNTIVRPASGGPPPPPAIKLGLQSAPQTMASGNLSVQKPVQTVPKPNLSLALNSESFKALNKNPVSALMEYAQSRKLVATVEVLSRKGSSHRPTFEMAAFVGEKQFPSVTCSNKKDGRKEACDIAMRQLIAEGQFQSEAATSIPPVPAANMTHFDTVAALTHRGFTALVSQITAESFAGRKVIAGLVMKRSADDVGVLISLGTGNRCITGQQLSLQGNTVNDSHAEIITRRGFLRFLYKRLLEYDPNKPDPMFEKSPSGKLQVRRNITFHLYISTAPCGDGALFSPRDAESSKAPIDSRVRPQHEPVFSSNVQGLLRTKVEGGEGTIPIEAGFKGQTFDGIQRGERLLTMSCSDKICRWNVVGMQGALLSHFLEPVYLDSLTLGLLYDYGHLCRAMCCRVGRGTPDVDTELPPSYHLNHPWLGRVTVCDPPREVQKTKALSVNWCFGDKGPEVTDGTQGLCYTSIEKGFFSRCSKRNLFMSFKELCERFGRQDLLCVKSYNDAKVAARDFMAAKEVMLRRFKENGCGKWVAKPVEEEMFGFEDS